MNYYEMIVNKAISRERLLPGEGYDVYSTGAGKRLNIQFPATPEPEPYDGPFAIRRESVTQVRLLAYAPEEKRYIRNFVLLGETLTDIPALTAQLSQASFVSLKIEYDDGYQFSLDASADLPSQSDDVVRAPLAYVTWNSIYGRIVNVFQLQYGNIIQLGRVL